MNEINIPVAAEPPSQPAIPPDRSAVDARNRDIRHRALQCAISYASAGLAVTVGQFWATVDAFEQYIGTGVHQ